MPDGSTLFAGFYNVEYRGLLQDDMPWPHADGMDKAGTVDAYRMTLDQRFVDLEGKLFIDWGPGKRSWIQHPHRQDKPIIELRAEFKEDGFPGYLDFIQPLSKIDMLPKGWIDALKASKGIYLPTCPKTKEQYVGTATGEDGFWRRWQDYSQSGHGGNVGLKSRDSSDYQVSILEVAGTAMTTDDILRAEYRWQAKMQSKAMGLNR
jgi:hypothetical protein